MKKIFFTMLLLICLLGCSSGNGSIFTNKVYTNKTLTSVIKEPSGKSWLYYIVFDGQRVSIDSDYYKEIVKVIEWNKDTKFDIIIIDGIAYLSVVRSN